MKYFFPPQNQSFKYLQTNRSDGLGSIWSSFNLDFIRKLGTMKLSNKLVTNTTTSDDADLGLPIAFEFFYNKWFGICGTRIFKQSAGNGDLVTGFAEDTSGYSVGSSTSQFDITNTTGTTYRYTWDGTGTNPGITALTFPIGGTVGIWNTSFAAGNRDFTKTITGSGTNYFEVTNASGVAETDKLIGSGFIVVSGGTNGRDYSINYSDLCIFNDCLWTTSSTGLFRKDIDTDVGAFGGWFKLDTYSAAIHKMVYFKKFNRLYYSSTSSFIKSIDSNYVVSSSGDYTLNLTNSIGTVRTMVANSNYIWVGTIRFNEAEEAGRNSIYGSISQWDGVSNQVTNEFQLTTSGILSMCILDDVPYAIDTKGRVLQYIGYTFKEIARLPMGELLLKNIGYNNATNGYPIHYNGLTSTENNTLQVLVNNLNGDNGGTINENLPSGIWELDLSTLSFTHKYSPTLKTLASSTVTDFGQNRILSAGAIKQNTYESASASGRSSLIAGFSYYTDATTSKSGIFIDSPSKPNTDTEGHKRGYFVTTQLESSQVTDNFLRLWAIYKRFANATDKLIFKYRLEEEDSIEATITWTSTATFTTTTNILAYVGFEAEILQGKGSGACTNILTITENAGTYTATIDAAVTGAAGTAKARFQKWIKLGEISNTTLCYGQLPIDIADVKIQIKGILEWTGDSEFAKIIINSSEDINIDS